jgi:hypothetical protein
VIFDACGTRAVGLPQLPAPPAGGERAPAAGTRYAVPQTAALLMTGWCTSLPPAAHTAVLPKPLRSQPTQIKVVKRGEKGRRLCEFDGCCTRLREDRSLRQPGTQHHAIRVRSYTGPVRRLAMRIATLLVLAGTVRGSGACCLLVRGLQIARQHCGYAHCVDDTEQERDLNASALSPRPCPGLFCVGRCLVS